MKERKPMMPMLKKLFSTLIVEAVRFDPVGHDPRREYPKTVAEVIDDEMQYKPEVYEALKKFSSSKPWSGTLGEMQFKFRVLNEKLASIYKIPVPQLVFVDKFPGGACCFRSKPAVIMMEPEKDDRYSVVCFLHEFAHALGKDERQACKWSINLFKRVFPNSYAKLDHKGHLLVKKESA